MAMRADVLSSLLALVRLRGDLVYRAELAAPWAIAFPPGLSHLHFVEHERGRDRNSDEKPLAATAS